MHPVNDFSEPLRRVLGDNATPLDAPIEMTALVFHHWTGFPKQGRHLDDEVVLGVVSHQLLPRAGRPRLWPQTRVAPDPALEGNFQRAVAPRVL
jgi:hypothetical protein